MYFIMASDLKGADGYRTKSAAEFIQPDKAGFPELYLWRDTCNVYVIRDGDSALLIDLGDGSVLDNLGKIGIKNVEWVLFTHHHREQCQGAYRLKNIGAKIGVPELERELFEQPVRFRKMDVSLGDKFTVYGASYVRPPYYPVVVERGFKTNDVFTWRGHEFSCVDTRGNSPASMSYLIKRGARLYAFSGDVMLAGSKMHLWFDTEWDYGFGSGIRALRRSVKTLIEKEPHFLLPSHGSVIHNPASQLQNYYNKLGRLEKLYLRGYGVESASNEYQDKVSKPTKIPDLWQVTPHIFKFKRTNFWANFSLILADSGRALVVDCGLVDEKFLEKTLNGLQEHFGLKTIDALIITHIHGDHFLEAEYLRQKWGTKIWALENMVDKMEHPEWFDYSALIQSYGKKTSDGKPLKSVKVDRALKPGETFDWEGYHFKVDWMPGQTEFALCLHGVVDGKKVAFTGDNIFGDPDDPAQTGHEAVVARNSAIFEEGYIYGAEFLKRLNPDIIIGGHSFVLNNPGKMIERYRRWSYEMRDAFAELSPEKDYRYFFDPFWVRIEPYRSTIEAGNKMDLKLYIRNFLPEKQQYKLRFNSLPSIVVEPSSLVCAVAGGSKQCLPLSIRVRPDTQAGVYIVAVDITIDNRRYGELFDFIVNVSK